MSFVTAAPEMLATAAQNVANIGTSLSAANATAAASTTSVLAAGADEVSQAIARLFSDYATHYQSLNAQAAAFHHSFVQTLNAAGGAYSSAEAANASAQALEQNLLAVINAPAQALFGRPLIGNGANGTAASPNGGDGGILYGNGGNGFSQTTAGVAGGAGGSAGPCDHRPTGTGRRDTVADPARRRRGPQAGLLSAHRLDALAAHRRAHGLPAISLGWGLWDQASAMTGGLATVDFKRFARDGIVAMSSADALQLFDTAMIVDEPFMLPAHIDFAALKVKFDGGTLPPMFVDLINAPTRRQVDDSLAAAKSKSALLQRLEGLPEDEQHAVLLDLVRSHIATVLGSASPEAIDPDRAFQELGFDSLTAVEMRNRLKSATGLALSPTLIFDYPNSAALAGYMRRELLGSSPQDTSAVAAGEAELQRIVASIPVKRLRQAGVLDLLLALANETETSGQDPALAPTAEQEIADMDLDDLVNAAFRNDDE
nr:PE domain-containing protein [Mycobacterium tuberculosis]